jgi:error-prone DNA polymerase
LEDGKESAVFLLPQGAVITRQRPGTASGLIFLTMEDETGYANVIVMSHIYEKYRQAVLEPRFVRDQGWYRTRMESSTSRQGMLRALMVSAAQMASHNFH